MKKIKNVGRGSPKKKDMSVGPTAPLHTVKEPDPYTYQVRMWAFYNTIH